MFSKSGKIYKLYLTLRYFYGTDCHKHGREINLRSHFPFSENKMGSTGDSTIECLYTSKKEDDVECLLAELKEISFRRSNERFEQMKRKTSIILPQIDNTTTCCSNEILEDNHREEDDAAQIFLVKTPESSTLNQYWYSRNTIKFLCDAIVEGLETFCKTNRVAFLSTPSLYFSYPIKARDSCKLFDVSKKIQNNL